MSQDALDLPVLVPTGQDGTAAGGRRRNDTLALALVPSGKREEILSRIGSCDLVLAEASTLEQAVSLAQQVTFELVLTVAHLCAAAEAALEVIPLERRPVVVDIESFAVRSPAGEDVDVDESAGEALRALAALCSFTHSPMTVAVMEVEGQDEELVPALLYRLRSCLRGSDVLGPWGSGRVVVGLSEAGREDAEVVLQRMRKMISASPVLDRSGKISYLSVAVGAASGSPELESLLPRAEQAVATASLNGPGRTVLLP